VTPQGWRPLWMVFAGPVLLPAPETLRERNYSVGGSTVNLTATAIGAAGNSVPLATTSPAITVSGSTLTGGIDGQASLVAYNNFTQADRFQPRKWE